MPRCPMQRRRKRLNMALPARVGLGCGGAGGASCTCERRGAQAQELQQPTAEGQAFDEGDPSLPCTRW